MKIGREKVTQNDYWFGVKTWMRSHDEIIPQIGTLKHDQITGILGHILFPQIKFDKSFKFIEMTPQIVTASICRGININYNKNFTTEQNT